VTPALLARLESLLAKQARQPAGVPGGHGGEFASSGDAGHYGFVGAAARRGKGSDAKYEHDKALDAVHQGKGISARTPWTEHHQRTTDAYQNEDGGPGGYSRLNGGLRSGSIGASDKHVQDMDHVTRSSSLDKPMRLYRGSEGPPPSKGVSFEDKGYVSTSLNRRESLRFSKPHEGGESTLYVIRAPAGSHVGRGQRSEAELILPRGSKFRVSHVRTVKHPRNPKKVLHIATLDLE